MVAPLGIWGIAARRAVLSLIDAAPAIGSCGAPSNITACVAVKERQRRALSSAIALHGDYRVARRWLTCLMLAVCTAASRMIVGLVVARQAALIAAPSSRHHRQADVSARRRW